MPNFYPASLTSFITKLSGFSKSSIRLFPQNQTTAVPYSEITLDLPPGQLIDPSSIAINFDLQTSATTADTTKTSSCCLPPPGGIEQLFSNFRLSATGSIIQSNPVNSYHHLWAILKDSTMGATEYERSVMQFGASNPGTGTGSSTVNQTPLINKERYALQSGTDATQSPYVLPATKASMWNFTGFLNSPELLDVDAIGQLRLHLTVAGPQVLLQNNVNNATFSLSNINLTCDTILLPTEYFAAQSAYLNGGPGRSIRRRFDNWSVHQGPIVPKTQTATQQTRFTLSSVSVDLLIGTFRNVYPTSGLGCFNENKNLQIAGTGIGTSDFFQRNGQGVQEWNFSVNGTQLVQYNPSADAAWRFTQMWTGQAHSQIGTMNALCTTLDRFKQAYWMAPVTLAPSADDDTRLVAGYPTRGTQAQFTWTTTGDGTTSSQNCATGGGYAGMDREPICFVKCSSILMIEAGKLVSVIP